METIKLKAEPRKEKSTKKSLSELREARRIPAVVYGGEGESLAVSVSENDLMYSLKTAGANAIITLQHDGVEDTVILKDLQRHVVTGRPIHADFQRITMTEKIEVEVPLHVVGEAPGVKTQGGVLDQALRVLSVSCLPNAIPQQIEVDVSALEMGHSIAVRDLKVPSDVEVLNEPDQLVANILTVKAEGPDCRPATTQAN